MMQRRDLDETWRHLEAVGLEMPRDSQGNPWVLPRMPDVDDEAPLGLGFYRRHWYDDDFSGLTIPRTYFGRSLIEGVNFRNTDLTESRMCWNEFINCDFSAAVLCGCDMRASEFTGCKFIGANLAHTDLRQSSFEGCDFTDANMTRAIAQDVWKGLPFRSSRADRDIPLNKGQDAVMDWREEAGPVPEGG